MQKRREGFTLVEIMIVVAIIGLLIAIAVPAFFQYRRDSENALFVNALRIGADSFRSYMIKHDVYPADRNPAQVPVGMAGYLANMDWTAPTPIGGLWDWDFNVFGVKAGLSAYLPDRTDAEMAQIDAIIDDGNLSTGDFRKRSQGYIYIIER
jgi:type IV pilus assembly protein PilA